MNDASVLCCPTLSASTTTHTRRAGTTSFLRAAITSVAGQLTAARLRGVACRSASVWLDALPTTRAHTMSDEQFRCAARLRLGLPQGPFNAVDVRCDCNLTLKKDDLDHPLTCLKRSGTKTMRHNIMQGGWRRVLRKAGITTSMDPVLKPLAAGNEDPKRPKSRGDILWISEGITVGDVSVIHPAADSYVAAAAKKEGSAAKNRDDHKKSRYELSDAAGYDFVSLTSEAVWENQPWTS